MTTNIGWDPAAPLPSFIPNPNVFTCKDGDFDITAGGADIWGNGDQGQITWTTKSGDFDAVVEVTGLTMADAISKAGLIVRQSQSFPTVASNDVTLYYSINPPPPGRDLGEVGVRSTVGGTTVTWAPSTNYVHVDGIPNAWQRLKRTGNLFTAYHSSNGVDWVLFGQTNQTLVDPVLVGLGTTGHNATNGLTTAQYRNFKISSVVTSPLITPGSAHITSGTFSATFQTQASVNYQVEYVNTLTPPRNWQPLGPPISGDGTIKPFSDPGPLPPTRFYRIHVP
jgi:hypothetical protein